MKASRFSDAQKAFILKQGADGMPVADSLSPSGATRGAATCNRLKSVLQVTP